MLFLVSPTSQKVLPYGNSKMNGAYPLFIPLFIVFAANELNKKATISEMETVQ